MIRLMVSLAVGLTPTLRDERAKAWIAAHRQDYRYGALIQQQEQQVQAMKTRFSGPM